MSSRAGRLTDARRPLGEPARLARCCEAPRARAVRGARASRGPPRPPRSVASTSGRRSPPTSWPSRFERRLRAGRARGDEQRLVDVAQRGVDLRAMLGLIDHPAHLVADDVARDEDPAGAADVERARERPVVAGVEREAVDRLRAPRRSPA